MKGVLDRILFALMNLDGWLALRRGAYSRAASAFGKAARIRPEPRVLYQHASSLARAGNFREAIGQYRELLRMRPRFAEGYAELGIALQALGFHAEALDAFEKAEEFGLCDGTLQYNWGVSLSALERRAAAIERYKNALAIAPDNCDAYGNLGAALLYDGDAAAAVTWLRKAIDCAPLEIFFYNLAQAYESLGRFEDEAATLRRGLEAHPTSSQLRTRLAMAAMRTGDCDRAKYLLDEAIELNTGAVEPLIAMSLLHQSLQHPEEALRYAYRAMELSPNDPRALSALGSALLLSGNGSEALESFARAIQKEPEEPEYLAGFGAALARLGRLKEATSAFERVLALAPSFFEADPRWRQYLEAVRNPSTRERSPAEEGSG